jgi:hypothetical protein
MKTKVMTRKCTQTDIKHTKGNGRSYHYLYPIGDLVQGRFHKGFHVCTDQRSFFKSFLINGELIIN